MSFPPGTEMFQFPGFASYAYLIQRTIPLARWVPPFGNSRIKACSRLPVTYRSVPRPSSPLSAKASTECPSCTSSLSFPMPASAPGTGHRQTSTTRNALPLARNGIPPKTFFSRPIRSRAVKPGNQGRQTDPLARLRIDLLSSQCQSTGRPDRIAPLAGAGPAAKRVSSWMRKLQKPDPVATATRRNSTPRLRAAPAEPGRAARAVAGNWWSLTGSNRRHPACKAGALPAELRPHFLVNHIIIG